MSAVQIRHFTDPGCPWAFSAEPRLRRLRWLYGEALEWETVMVVLSDDPADYASRGFTAEMMASGTRDLAERFGMPIDWKPRERMSATAPACRAVVAARLNAPGTERTLLRRLRVLSFAGAGLLDEPALHRRAAVEAGLDPDLLEAWMNAPETEQALGEDRAAARSPLPAARALDHKLAGPPDERRYTCPSMEIAVDGARVAVPGFQPLEAYEAAIANLDPALERRADPTTVGEVLAWAGEPLATAEVIAVCDRDSGDVRSELARTATFEPVGADGYWTPAGA